MKEEPALQALGLTQNGHSKEFNDLIFTDLEKSYCLVASIRENNELCGVCTSQHRRENSKVNHINYKN